MVLQFFAMVTGVAVFALLLFLAFKFFIIFLIAGLCLATLIWLRGYLVTKGILNPKPGVGPDITVIEVEYEKVETKDADEEK